MTTEHPREHRPLPSGINILSATELMGNVVPILGGTLTGTAIKKDGTPVLVTCQHCLMGVFEQEDGKRTWSVVAHPEVSMYEPERTIADRVGVSPIYGGLSNTSPNLVDVAACELEHGVRADFKLHDATNHASPPTRKYISGVVEPELGNTLLVMGAVVGEATAEILEVGYEVRADGFVWPNAIRLKANKPIKLGDSGAGCFLRVREGVYRLACILFSVQGRQITNDQGEKEWVYESREFEAFPASAAERELGITFGEGPIAKAGDDQTVAVGVTVTLDASGSEDLAKTGNPLTYRWDLLPRSGLTAGVELSDNTIASPTFSAPPTATTVAFKLRVTDSEGGWHEDTVTISVVAVVQPALVSNLSAAPGDRQITLTWDDPDDDSITGYEYRLNRQGSTWPDEWVTAANDAVTNRKITITGLTNGVAYNVRLRAVNVAGEGPERQIGPITAGGTRRRRLPPSRRRRLHRLLH